MSPTLISIFSAAGGVVAGLAASVIVVFRFLNRLDDADRRVLTAEQRAEAAEREARTDETTGLPNRRAFTERLQEALAAGNPVGVVMIDLDDFKAVNDTFSHEAGNDVLTAVGLRLTGLPAPVQLAARLSGDEFVLLVAGDTEQTRACARAAWRTITSQPVPVADRHEWNVRASVGYATDGGSARDLLRRADATMYQAKTAGGGVCDTALAAAPPLPPAHTRCRDARRRA
ncbi:diguanylate cyclase (GGDEF)-like protein [Actinoplanes octamycinicus]|uniref:Diguanylate cyclase (GGDEF)-like protein n=1 Tax=Actinoplanes octamycinicus TaxID=135948 RepID=A0A7W7GU64_9ACTN|nr:GGDEF domain-containing protein [Actinoplanes octamycinicus]MBB4738341.1 diguanylate cyclase (GGDEF)-like protein [Actinoplanes octamycinicus]GIE57458.1 hypothetical protein Aoc01nite_28600 [Actinoplanes octamycinicus]